jgi:hypothetical protein
MIKLKIQSGQDRDTVALILIKNGYQVTRRKIFDKRGKVTSFELYVEGALSASEAARENEAEAKKKKTAFELRERELRRDWVNRIIGDDEYEDKMMELIKENEK